MAGDQNQTTNHLPPGVRCKGDYSLGTACGRCDRCDDERHNRGIPDGWVGRWPKRTKMEEAATLRSNAKERRREVGRLEVIIQETLAEADRLEALARMLDKEAANGN